MTKPKVVVIGAGAIGLSCALRLAQRGASVVLIDGEVGPAEGASASLAAAGMLGPIAESLLEPPNAHPRAMELALASFDLWRATPQPLRRCARFDGGLILGDDNAAVAANAAAYDRKSEALSRAEIARRFGIETSLDGLYVEDEGVVDAPAMLRGLAGALAAAGGTLHFDVEANTIEDKPWRRVQCFGGEAFTADFIVVAPGAWAREKMQEIVPALKHIQPAKGALAAATLKAELKVNVRAKDFYLAARGAEDVVLGATMEFGSFDRRADPAKIDALFAAVERALPGQVTRAERPAWAGVRPMSPDWSPMIGPSGPDGVLVVGGHSRNGWLLAPITAEIIAAYVFGEDLPPLWAAFSPDRFESIP
ncbi:MAG: FAD-dependent oxidoreductase [Terricaulis sp.]